jgi:hypothetical protein
MIAAQTIVETDPCARCAVAVLDEAGNLLEVVDMPSMEANGRTATNALLLAWILARPRNCSMAGKR